MIDTVRAIKNIQNVAAKLRHRGAYVDYWTCVHFASGACIGFFLAQAGFSFFGGFIVAAIAFVLWELFEPPLHSLIGRHFPELISNQVVDVVTGAIGYLIGFSLASPSALIGLLLDVLDFLAA